MSSEESSFVREVTMEIMFCVIKVLVGILEFYLVKTNTMFNTGEVQRVRKSSSEGQEIK